MSKGAPIPDNPANAIRQLILLIGDDPNREGLRETPDRVMRAYAEMFSGYREDPAVLMKTFTDGTCDEMVLVKDVTFDSFCEHHLLAFSGVAHVGYIPDGRIIGLSKIARLVDLFAKRLQVQERLTVQITGALMEHLKPKGAGCVIQARHSCMACRGVKKQGAKMVTSSLEGVIKDDPRTRQEFLSLIKG